MNENNVVNYGWSTAKGPTSCGYIAPKIIEILNNLRAHRVLDIGSGNGKLCHEIATNGMEAVGMEYDEQGVEIARSNYPGIKFYNLGVQDMPSNILEQEEAFDVVVSTEVIEHLYSPHLLPIFAREVIKEKGFLILTTPYHGYLKNLAISVFNKWDKHHTVLWHGGHIKFWSRKTLTSLLEEKGFKVIAFTGVGRLPYLWKSMVLVAQKQ